MGTRKNSRAKGKAGELEAVHLFQRWFSKARRGLQFRDGTDAPDVEGTPFWVEVKRYAKLYPATWANAYNQATSAMVQACELENIPDLQDIVVVARENRNGWRVLAEARFLYELGYRGENHQFQHKELVDGLDLRRIEWEAFERLLDTQFTVKEIEAA